MTRWQETALAFVFVGTTVALAGRPEGLVIVGFAVLMYVSGDPVS